MESGDEGNERERERGGRIWEEECSNNYPTTVQINISTSFYDNLICVAYIHVQCASVSWPIIFHVHVPLFHRLRPGVQMNP